MALHIDKKGQIHLRNWRAAFVDSLWTPFENTGDDGKTRKSFGLKLLAPPNHPDIEGLRAEIDKAGKEKFKDKWPAVKKAAEKLEKLPIHDGDDKAEWDGFAGHMYVAANSKVRPTIVNRDKSQISEEDGIIYSGCYVNAIVTLYGYDNKSKGVGMGLKGVQFVKDGDAFGAGAPASEDDFDEVEDDDLAG